MVHGERFMLKIDPDAELAPRDVVRAGNLRRSHEWARRLAGLHQGRWCLVCREFPTVYKYCRDAGIDPVTDPYPLFRQPITSWAEF